MANSVNTSYQPTPRRAYISAIPFNNYFFTYIPANLNLNIPVLVPVPGASTATCPVGRVLHETGRKIYPGVNPGITTPMVAVYDNISLLSGFIDPNSAAFAVYSTDASYFAPNGVDPTTNQPDLGPAVITNVVAGSYIQPKLYVPGFNQVLFPAGLTATAADVFVNPYLGTMFEININPVAQPFLTTINCYLRSPTAPNADLVVPIGQNITILLSNMGGNTITLNFMEGVTPPSYPGFYSGTPPLVVPTTAVSTVAFALDGVEAYPVGSSAGSGGSTGPAGRTGPTGPQGFQGLQGVGGDATNTGATGTTGTQGVQGDVGFQGLIGPQGLVGPQGIVGPQGSQGLQGNAGTASLTGSTGNTGPQGVQGFQGIVGAPGTASLTGSTGPTGIQGGGSTGPTGTTGPRSPTGTTGPTGMAALPGSGPFANRPVTGPYIGYFYLATDVNVLYVWGGNTWGTVTTNPAPTVASPAGQNPHGLYQDAPQPPSTELYPGYTYYATDVFGLMLWDGNQYNIIATTPI